jgi:hypothetical protein
MAEMPKAHLVTTTIDGVLVVRIEEPQFHGEPVHYLSSAAFRPLLSVRRKLQETGGHLVLCQLSPLITELFQLLRLISTNRAYPATFEVQPDVAGAVAFLNGSASGSTTAGPSP